MFAPLGLATKLTLAQAVSAPAWSVAIDGLQAMAAARGGDCVAVEGRDAVTVIDRSGTIRWRTEMPEPARRWNPVVAVSADCEIAAVTTEFGGVGLLRSSGAATFVPIVVTPDDPHPDDLLVRSLDVSADGSMIVVGLERGGLALVSREKGILWRKTFTSGQPVEARFVDDDRAIAVERFFDTGVFDLSGERKWLGGARFREIRGSKNLKSFVALYAPMHGIQGGIIAWLDKQGVELWTKGVFDPQVLMIPDGTRAVVSAIFDAKSVPGQDVKPDLAVVDRAGAFLVRKSIDAFLHGVTSDGTCIFTQESKQDLVVRDLQLSERFRIAKAFGLGPRPAMAGQMVFVGSRTGVSGYSIPTCEAIRQWGSGAVRQ